MSFRASTRTVFRSLLLLGSLLIGMHNAHADTDADDAYLQGYLSAILEQQLGWPSNSYSMKVNQAVAIVITRDKNNADISSATDAFSKIPMLVDFNFVEDVTDNSTMLPSYIHYPRGDYFKPVIADVKEPQFFVSFVRIDTKMINILLGSVGLGQNFGLYRWPASKHGDGWQLSFFAGIFSQFNMDTSSDDLLNTDYLVGLPLSFRHGNLSGRLRFFHQSSHLGDELLLSGNAPTRINLSIEGVDLLLAYDIGDWRGAIGGTQIFSHDPEDLEQQAISTSIDYRSSGNFLGNSRFIAGIRTEWLEEVNWTSGTSIKFGVEIGKTYPARHGTRIMFEAYKGFVPFGQFYTADIEYYGVGVYFDFN